MKSASTALIALLASRQFLMADLFTFTLKSGTVVRYTSADGALTVGGNPFLAARIERGTLRAVKGIEVDTLTIDMWPALYDTIAGVPILQAIRSGAFDNAELLLERCFMGAWGDTSAGTIILFKGRVSDLTASRTHAELQVKSFTELLNIQLPREMYQPTCLNSLGDAQCGINLTTYQATSAATAGSTQTAINCGLTAFPAGWFANGVITFTSGVNTGVSRSVRSFTPGVVALSIPLVAMPSVGDTFTIVPGCDRRQSTCGSTAKKAFTAVAATDVCTSTAHDLDDGDRITVTNSGGALPAPLVSGLIYYVAAATADTFKISLTYGGAAVNLTTAGTGTQSVRAVGKFDNLPKFRGHPYIPIPETAT